MANKLKYRLQYLNIRYRIGSAQRFLIAMVSFITAAIVFAGIGVIRENIVLLTTSFFGILCSLVWLIKNRLHHSRFEAYHYYKVKKNTGMIQMRCLDLYRIFEGKTDKEVKDLLIEHSYSDFIRILKDYKEASFSNRVIQAHKTFIRPYMRALRASGLVAYHDLELENFLTEAVECDGVELEECFFPEANGYRVKLKYLGCMQNKMLALRYPISKCTNKHLHKFAASVPYYEVTITRS